MIVYSCGMCGCAIDEHGAYVYPLPVDYNPDNYPHVWCDDCHRDEQQKDWEQEQERQAYDELWHKENDK